MSFAVRMGFEVQNPLGLEEMSEKLSNSLWNILLKYFFSESFMGRSRRYQRIFYYSEPSSSLYTALWTDCLHEKSNSMADSAEYKLKALEKYWDACEPYQKYGIIEFLALQDYPDNKNYTEECNVWLKKLGSPYHFQNRLLMPITNKLELAEVGQALSHPKSAVQEHMKNAVKHFSDRENEHYRQAADESISALESLLTSISGQSTLGNAIPWFKRKQNEWSIHNHLLSSLDKLWSYANDNVRHGQKENELPVTFDEAKFMVVTCSAWINYITAKQAAMTQ